MLHDVFVDNVSKQHDEHGPHCTHMRWNCVKDHLHHAVRHAERVCATSARPRTPQARAFKFRSFFLKSSTSCHTSTGSFGSSVRDAPWGFFNGSSQPMVYSVRHDALRLGRRAALCLPRRGATRCLGNRRRIERHRRPRSRSPPSHQ